MMARRRLTFPQIFFFFFTFIFFHHYDDHDHQYSSVAFFVDATTSSSSSNILYEEDRIAEYYNRHHIWPPSLNEYIPSTNGWQQVMNKRIHQLSNMKHRDDDGKFNGLLSTIHSGLICPNYTESGWGLTKAPKGLVRELLYQLHEGLASGNLPEEDKEEGDVDDEYPKDFPLMLELSDSLQQQALQFLQPILESWSKVPLIPHTAYGLRIYRKQSNLLMHIDQAQSHVISAILHVDHDPLGSPWPLVLDDFHGQTNEIFLETGDLLLYESSKCFHGRPYKFDGSWYTSLFLHFYPKDWNPEQIDLDTRIRIPPNWQDTHDDDDDEDDDNNDNKDENDENDELVIMQTSQMEPNCEFGWCGLKQSLKWYGPAEAYGVVLSGGGKRTILDIPPDDSADWKYVDNEEEEEEDDDDEEEEEDEEEEDEEDEEDDSEDEDEDDDNNNDNDDGDYEEEEEDDDEDEEDDTDEEEEEEEELLDSEEEGEEEEELDTEEEEGKAKDEL